MWASLAITVIWLAVLFSAVYGPDVRTVEAGGASTVVPSALGVAFFAVFATWAVAKYGYYRKQQDG